MARFASTAGPQNAAADADVMPSISGLVVTLSGDPAVDTLARSAADAMGADSRFMLGEPAGLRVPVVLEVPTDSEAEIAFDWLSDLPGVTRVDVTFVSLAEGLASHAGPQGFRRRQR